MNQVLDTTEARQIVETIYMQIGAGRAMAMIGGSAISDTENLTLRILFKARASQSIKKFFIQYDNGADIYNVTFYTRTDRVVATETGIYADQLKRIIEKETGLYLSM